MNDYSDFGITIPRGRISGEVTTTCPKCSHNRRKRQEKCLSVNLDKAVWNCHHCGHKGGLRGSIQQYRPTNIFRLPASRIYIPFDAVKDSSKGYRHNSFVKHLHNLFDGETVKGLIESYYIGSNSDKWPGSCVFWFVDVKGRVSAGQVKPFDESGHTAKYPSGGKKTTWIHKILIEKYQPSPASWLSKYDSQDRKINCLFGEHLLPLSSKPVAIVEAPATAIIASVYLSKFTWLAVGALKWLTVQKCEVLKGRKVILYPDLKAYNEWKRIADELGFNCSDFLEKNASEEEKRQGLDLRDFLERFDITDFTNEIEKKFSFNASLPSPTSPEPKPITPEYDLSGGLIDPRKGYPVTWA